MTGRGPAAAAAAAAAATGALTGQGDGADHKLEPEALVLKGQAP